MTRMMSACGVLCSDCPAYFADAKGVAHQERTASAWQRIYGLMKPARTYPVAAVSAQTTRSFTPASTVRHAAAAGRRASPRAPNVLWNDAPISRKRNRCGMGYHTYPRRCRTQISSPTLSPTAITAAVWPTNARCLASSLATPPSQKGFAPRRKRPASHRMWEQRPRLYRRAAPFCSPLRGTLELCCYCLQGPAKNP